MIVYGSATHPHLLRTASSAAGTSKLFSKVRVKSQLPRRRCSGVGGPANQLGEGQQLH